MGKKSKKMKREKRREPNQYLGHKRWALTRENVPYWISYILDYARIGDPFETFLLVEEIRESEWNAYVKKNKPLQLALKDAHAFARAAAQNKVKELMYMKGLNQTVAKMYLEQVAGWKQDGGTSDGVPPQVTINVSPTTTKAPGGNGSNGGSNGKGKGK